MDRCIGEAVGQLYVEKYFPPEARARMNDLVENLKTVFRDHLEKVDWMTDATRAKALAKFARFTHKIGYPDKFRDYSSIVITARRLPGQRPARGGLRGTPRNRARRQNRGPQEWHMTPPTVNAYFNPSAKRDCFSSGYFATALFRLSEDDAVNYGAIGVVIGHEITHGLRRRRPQV